MDAIEEDAQDQGDGDSVVDAEEMDVLNELVAEVETERLKVLIKQEDDTDEAVLDADSNQLRFDLEDLDEDTKLPVRPKDWQPKPPNTKLNEPNFDVVDNPGNWCEYTFLAKFGTDGKGKDKKKKYLHHALPTGCTPVPMNDEGSNE